MTVALATTLKHTVITWRCWKCERVIGVYRLPVGFLRLRCKRCGAWNELVNGEQRPAA